MHITVTSGISEKFAYICRDDLGLGIKDTMTTWKEHAWRDLQINSRKQITKQKMLDTLRKAWQKKAKFMFQVEDPSLEN